MKSVLLIVTFLFTISHSFAQKGKIEGKIEGKLEERTAIILRLHSMGRSVEEICEILGVDREAVR